MSVLNLVHKLIIPKRNEIVIPLLKAAQFEMNILTDFTQIGEN